MFYQKYIIPLFVFSSVFIAVSGCSEEIYQKPPLSTFKNDETKIPYPQIDQDLGEKLQPNEALLALEVVVAVPDVVVDGSDAAVHPVLLLIVEQRNSHL